MRNIAKKSMGLCCDSYYLRGQKKETRQIRNKTLTCKLNERLQNFIYVFPFDTSGTGNGDRIVKS